MTIDLQTVFEGICATVAVLALIYAAKQVWEAQKSRFLSTYLTFEERISNPSARADRRTIYNTDLSNPEALNQETRIIVDRVCATFDILGVFIKLGFMYKPLVFKLSYDVIIKCWQKTADYIKFESSAQRRGKNFMTDFYYLYTKAEAFRKKNKLPDVKIYHDPSATV